MDSVANKKRPNEEGPLKRDFRVFHVGVMSGGQHAFETRNPGLP
jgi:hypothetical protein